MDSKLEINTSLLPEEGLTLSGELDGSLFDLSNRDAKPVSSLSYDLSAQCFESELLLQGSLEATFEFQCVVTNRPFLKTISLDNCAIAIEVHSGVTDATEALREEVLIEFPAHPRCDQADDPTPCIIDERYLAVDKPTDDSVNRASQPVSDDRWGALDGLNNLPESSS